MLKGSNPSKPSKPACPLWYASGVRNGQTSPSPHLHILHIPKCVILLSLLLVAENLVGLQQCQEDDECMDTEELEEKRLKEKGREEKGRE
eukprot:754952-Hanusia_phi.AAC.4